MSGFLKNRKLVAAVLCVLLLGITFGLGALAVYKGQDAYPNGGSSTSVPAVEPSAPQDDPQPDEEESPGGDSTTPVFFNRPSQMQAVYLSAGVDYFTGAGDTAEQVQAQLDAALSSVEGLGMNTVILDLSRGTRSIWLKGDLPTATTDFDPLEMAIAAARAKGLYVYTIFPVLQGEQGGEIVSLTTVDTAVKEKIVARVRAFVTGYDMDGILLDDYYHIAQPTSYAQYMRAGGGVGYDAYMHLLPEDLFAALSDEIRGVAPGVQIGMMTESVWANQAYNSEGSSTNASFTTLYTGHVDNRSFVEDGYVDFVAVKALTADTDKSVPFKTVAAWWGAVAAGEELPMYIIHAADKACTDATGWTEYDQLTKQLIALSNTPGWSGSIFNSLSRMVEDPKSSTTMVKKFFNDDINPKFVLTELAVTEPKQKTYTTFEPSVTFKGASDPYTDVSINGQKINTDQNGYFNLNYSLKEGLNTFTIVHKGRTEVFKITRQVQVLKEISPTGNMNIDGEMKVTITATAYKDAKVYATIGGQTISMSPMETESDETAKDSSYIRFAGTYTAPAATTAVQTVGNIMVYGEAQGRQEKKEGALIKINKKAVIGDGTPIQVVANQAETFPTNVLNDYSDPDHFPLPLGTLDYSVGNEIVYKDGEKTYSYYNLASGLRVYSKDIRAVSDSYAVDDNAITGMTVEATERYTKVILKTKQKVSYSGRYDGSSFKLTFNYTSTTPDSLNLNKNPLFTSANWSGATLTLKLAKQGGFLGYRAYYDSNDNLVFQFNNPTGLSGAKIVIDPGHGGADPGASGFLPSYPESVINRGIAEALTQELRSRGANVVMLETDTYPKTTLEQRVQASRNANPHLFISIHCNSSPTNSSATGTEAYYFYGYAKGLATAVSSQVSQSLSTSNRGGKFGYYYVTRDAHCPAILLETGFLSNEREYKKLVDPDYQEEIAAGVANGIRQFLNSTNSGLDLTGTQSTGSTVSVGSSSGSSQDEEEETEASLTLAEEEILLTKGESKTLKYTLTGSSSKVVWESDDPSVATVSSSGKVTAVKEGEAIITASTQDGELFSECLVTVEGGASTNGEEKAPTRISFAQEVYEVTVGKNKTIKAVLTPTNASTDILWDWVEIDGEDVLDFEENGNVLTVTGLNEGAVELTAYSALDEAIYGTCVVMVNE